MQVFRKDLRKVTYSWVHGIDVRGGEDTPGVMDADRGVAGRSPIAMGTDAGDTTCSSGRDVDAVWGVVISPLCSPSPTADEKNDVEGC